jgi:hypothetical protein
LEQTQRQLLGQSSPQYFDCCPLNIVRDAKDFQGQVLRVQNPASGVRVTVSGLTDATDIDEVNPTRLKLELGRDEKSLVP